MRRGRLLERIVVEFLVARELHLAYRRPLLDDDDQHAALDFESHVAEKTRRIQRLDRGGGLFIVDTVADLEDLRRALGVPRLTLDGVSAGSQNTCAS